MLLEPFQRFIYSEASEDILLAAVSKSEKTARKPPIPLEQILSKPMCLIDVVVLLQLFSRHLSINICSCNY